MPQALYARRRTGLGQALSISLFDSLAEWMAVPLLHFDYGNVAPMRVGLRHPSIAPYGAFSCRHGHVVVIAIQNEREWLRFCEEVLQDPSIARDPLYSSNPLRVANRPSLDAIIGSAFSGLDRDELIRRLRASATAYGGLNSVSDLSAHPQLRRIRVESPTGPVDLPMSPIMGSGTDRLDHVPAVDSHGAAIRKEFA
jgi:itaconate CoA-transferase